MDRGADLDGSHPRRRSRRVGAKALEAEGLVNFLAGTEGSRAAAILYETDDGWRVSMRSLPTDVDVAAIAAEFGGGGHPRAAGCKVAGGEEAKQAFLARVAERIAPPIRRGECLIVARSGGGRLHGYVVIDKPAGWTSHDVVARLRRLLGERRVGHAGTLDPAATGVLPVAVGQATKSIEFLAAATKTYLAEITFGVATDSYDGDGTVVDVRPVADLTADEVTTADAGVRRPAAATPADALGDQDRRAAALRPGATGRSGRAGATVDRRVRVFADRLGAAGCDGSASIAPRAPTSARWRTISAPTVGVGAYLSDLVRLRTGPFSLLDAWTMSELEAMDLQQDWPSVAVHPDAGALDLDGLLVGAEDARRFAQGQIVTAEAAASGPVRAYDEAGAWLGIGAPAADGPGWRPNKVNVDAA